MMLESQFLTWDWKGEIVCRVTVLSKNYYNYHDEENVTDGHIKAGVIETLK